MEEPKEDGENEDEVVPKSEPNEILSELKSTALSLMYQLYDVKFKIAAEHAFFNESSIDDLLSMIHKFIYTELTQAMCTHEYIWDDLDCGYEDTISAQYCKKCGKTI
jgi:hypothetical protein